MGEGEPLVLLHGDMIDHRMWDQQFLELARRFQVLRYDSGNHGLSRIRGGNATTYEDLGALMNHLDLRSAHLMGLSLGGRIAVDFAIDYPERVRSLTLVSSGLSGYEFDGGFYPSGCFRRLPRFKSRHLERLFRAGVLRRLVDKGLIREETVCNLLTWRHSGFSVHGAVRMKDRQGAERLGRTMIRCPRQAAQEGR